MRIPIPEIRRNNAPSGDARAVSTPFIGSGDVQDLAQGIGALGRAQGQITQQIEADANRFEFEQKKARTVERASQARLQWTETLLKRQGEAQGEAANFTPSVLKDFDGWLDQSKTAITDPDERRMFEGMAGEIRGHIGSNALRFEVGQRRAYRKQVITTGIDTDAKVAGFDPSQVPALVASRVAAIGSIDGFDPDERQALTMAARESIGFQAGATLARTDPDGWLKRDPKNDPVAGLLDPEKLRQLNNFARSEIEQRQARAQAGSDRAMREATKMIDDLQAFVIDGGNPSPEYEAQVMQMVGGVPKMKTAAQNLIATARRGAAFGNLPIQMQARALEQVTPGDPKQQVFKRHLETVHAQQKRAYEEDPWAAAAKYGRAPVPQTYNIEAAEQIPMVVGERLRTQTNVENLSGKPESPLRPAEVASTVRALLSVGVDKRADILAQTGQQLNVEQIAKLADQLDKNDKPTALMLKAGGLRTTGDRSLAVLIGRGAQALQDKTITPDNNAITGWRSTIAGTIRGLGLGGGEQDAIDMAYYVRSALDAPGYEYDTKTTDRAIELVVGKVKEIGGTKFRLPRGMEESAFYERLRQAAAQSGPTFMVRGSPVPAATIIRRIEDMGFARDEQGRYTPFYNGAAVFLPSGEPLTLTP